MAIAVIYKQPIILINNTQTQNLYSEKIIKINT